MADVRPARLFRSAAVGLTGVACFGIDAMSPSVALTLLGAALLVGLPHGALDHVIAERSRAWRGKWGQVWFHASYLTAVAAVLLGWWLVPGPTLLLFLLVAVWHFGETDFLHVDGDAQRASVVLSRGLMIVFGAIHASPEAAIQLLEVASATDVERQLPLARSGGLWVPLALWAVHVRVLWGVLGRGSQFSEATADATALALLITGAGPLIAFPLYFIVCHTPDHVTALIDRSDDLDDLLAVMRAAAPRTLVSLVGIVALWVMLGTAQWVTAVWWLVSALTLPHAVVVHLMWVRGEESVDYGVGWTEPREMISA